MINGVPLPVSAVATITSPALREGQQGALFRRAAARAAAALAADDARARVAELRAAAAAEAAAALATHGDAFGGDGAVDLASVAAVREASARADEAQAAAEAAEAEALRAAQLEDDEVFVKGASEVLAHPLVVDACATAASGSGSGDGASFGAVAVSLTDADAVDWDAAFVDGKYDPYAAGEQGARLARTAAAAAARAAGSVAEAETAALEAVADTADRAVAALESTHARARAAVEATADAATATIETQAARAAARVRAAAEGLAALAAAADDAQTPVPVPAPLQRALGEYAASLAATADELAATPEAGREAVETALGAVAESLTSTVAALRESVERSRRAASEAASDAAARVTAAVGQSAEVVAESAGELDRQRLAVAVAGTRSAASVLMKLDLVAKQSFESKARGMITTLMERTGAESSSNDSGQGNSVDASGGTLQEPDTSPAGQAAAGLAAMRAREPRDFMLLEPVQPLGRALPHLDDHRKGYDDDNEDENGEKGENSVRRSVVPCAKEESAREAAAEAARIGACAVTAEAAAAARWTRGERENLAHSDKVGAPLMTPLRVSASGLQLLLTPSHVVYLKRMPPDGTPLPMESAAAARRRRAAKAARASTIAAAKAAAAAVMPWRARRADTAAAEAAEAAGQSGANVGASAQSKRAAERQQEEEDDEDEDEVEPLIGFDANNVQWQAVRRSPYDFSEIIVSETMLTDHLISRYKNGLGAVLRRPNLAVTGIAAPAAAGSEGAGQTGKKK